MRFLTMFALAPILFISCGDNKTPDKTPATSTLSADTSLQVETIKEPEKEIFTIEAQFVEFSFDDAEHYIFRDETGKTWDFTNCYAKEFKFSRLLPEEEINEKNQGWGYNEHLVGKWFQLTYYKTIQQQYIGGPESESEIIKAATQITNKQPNLTGYFKLKIEELTEENEGFRHTGNVSPDGSKELILTDVDHGYVTIEVKSDSNTISIEDLSVAPAQIVWSASGEFILIHEKDFYADAGSIGITVVNVISGRYQKITTELMLDDTDTELRDKFNIYSLVWLDANTFAFKPSVTYQGESGHPGINQNRQTKLGEHFAQTADSLALTPLQVEISSVEHSSRNGNTDTPHHYICFNDDNSTRRMWVSYSEDGKALAIKQHGARFADALVYSIEFFSTGGAHPNITKYYNSFANGKFMGTLKLTHSGNWDYAEFTNRNWSKRTYTIDHEANPYGNQPCF